MKHSFLVAYSEHASPFMLEPQPACTASCGQGVWALILGLAGNSISCSRVCHGSKAWTLRSWHGYLAVKYSVSKGPLLPSTQAVTTSAWPGDTPWVNKWGACQSAHHNSSETLVREDLDMLGFGFFQLYCCLYRPGWITLHGVRHAQRIGLGEKEWPVLWRVFSVLWAHLCSKFVSEVGFVAWWFFSWLKLLASCQRCRLTNRNLLLFKACTFIRPSAWRPT